MILLINIKHLQEARGVGDVFTDLLKIVSVCIGILLLFWFSLNHNKQKKFIRCRYVYCLYQLQTVEL